ncbi:serine hydrolase domain-containing protein [Sphingomonas oryzagri]
MFDVIRSYLQRLSDSGEIPGAVFRLNRRGKVIFHEAIGFIDLKRTSPIPLDGMFRAKSMTKLVTTILVLQAAERGLVSLLDPVARFLPSFGEMKVLADPDGFETQPLRRPVTLYDLLTHTSGLSYGQTGRATNQIYKEAGLYFDIDFRTPLSTMELVERLSALPLAFQPGSRWAYSWASDVLGRVLEVIWGEALDTIFSLKLLAPLGVPDIGFRAGSEHPLIPAPEHERIFYRDLNEDDGGTFFSGGEGLLSTADAWGRLVDFVVDDDIAPELLSSRSRQYMISDHVGRLRELPGFPLQQGYTYGMGSYVRLERGLGTAQGMPGEFGWWGSWGASFWGSRSEQISAVLMMQQPDESRAIVEAVKFMSYAALVS